MCRTERGEEWKEREEGGRETETETDRDREGKTEKEQTVREADKNRQIDT